MFGWTGRSSLVVAVVVCAGIGAGSAMAVQASASGGTARPAPAPATQATPGPGPMHAAAARVTPFAAATNVHCGQILTASVTLNGDLDCSSAALIIAGNNVNLNLGGHDISGAVGYSGVEVEGTSDTVQNGVILFFTYGVRIDSTGKTDTVLNLRSTNNQYGIYDLGTGTKITTSVASRNAFDGINSSASGGTYSGDHEVSNGSAGLNLNFASFVTVTGNIANDNRSTGIYNNGGAITLTKNVANFNSGDGIVVLDLTVIDGGGNTAKGNDYGTGFDPQQCSGIVCT